MGFKDIIKKIILGKRASSDSYIAYLRKIGIEIGKDVTIYVPTKTLIDEQYPWMISIGDHVRITEGVKILTHDYSWSVLKCSSSAEVAGSIMGSSGKVQIGSNVFIGMNSIITCGVSVGDNVIIGAGSVVTGKCESGYVYAGVPARKIMSLNEFYEKRKKNQVSEAVELVNCYLARYNKIPPKEVLHEYFMLFENSKTASINNSFVEKMKLGTGIEQSVKYMSSNDAMFANYEAFINYTLNMLEKKDVNKKNN